MNNRVLVCSTNNGRLRGIHNAVRRALPSAKKVGRSTVGTCLIGNHINSTTASRFRDAHTVIIDCHAMPAWAAHFIAGYTLAARGEVIALHGASVAAHVQGVRVAETLEHVATAFGNLRYSMPMSMTVRPETVRLINASAQKVYGKRRGARTDLVHLCLSHCMEHGTTQQIIASASYWNSASFRHYSFRFSAAEIDYLRRLQSAMNCSRSAAFDAVITVGCRLFFTEKKTRASA